ncbi:hypothetical protein [Desulfobulbus propionicus]
MVATFFFCQQTGPSQWKHTAEPAGKSPLAEHKKQQDVATIGLSRIQRRSLTRDCPAIPTDIPAMPVMLVVHQNPSRIKEKEMSYDT